MGSLSRRLAAAGVALAVLLTPARAASQNVMAQVLGAETSEPLVGAVVRLVTASGEVVSSRLSDRSGRALFTDVEAGSYRVRAEMLGRSTGESEVFAAGVAASVPLVLRLPTHAIELEGVQVTADAGPCRRRPLEEGRLLADVWGEASKALGAAAVADERGLYRYQIEMSERDLDANTAVVSEERSRRRGYMRTPFESRAVEDLIEDGFVSTDEPEWTYYAPDAQVLLSDDFQSTHCFRLVEGGPEEAGLIGVGFEPSGENAGVSDIAGTLWIDRESVEPRWLDYSYRDVAPDVHDGDATGRVEFQRLPEGTWIVPEWWIRMPKIEVDLARGRSRRIVGYHQTGGTVLEIVEAGGRDLGRGVTTGEIEGIVIDSLGLPIPSVRVWWIGSNQTVFANDEGRFTLVGMSPGTYTVRFVDPGMESLGLPPAEITRDVAGGVSTYVEYHMPTPTEMLREACGDEADAESGILAGAVLDQVTGRPIVDAVVRVRWSSYDVAGVPGSVVARETSTTRETTTDELGSYRFCGVPRREELTLVTVVDGDESRAERLALSADEVAHIHVIRRRP